MVKGKKIYKTRLICFYEAERNYNQTDVFENETMVRVTLAVEKQAVIVFQKKSWHISTFLHPD